MAASEPFLLPTKKYPRQPSPRPTSKRITAAIQQTRSITDVIPAYHNRSPLSSPPSTRPTAAPFIAVELAARRRNALQNDMSAAAPPPTSHAGADSSALGLDEVDRITAEMTALAHKAGFKDLASLPRVHQRRPEVDSRLLPNRFSTTIVTTSRRCNRSCLELFTFIPGMPLSLWKPSRPSRPRPQRTTQTGDTRRQTSRPRRRRHLRLRTANARCDDEAIAYHEGIPGHHMQLSVAAAAQGPAQVPAAHLGFSAYIEGWALYAEQLGKEVGFYQDPASATTAASPRSSFAPSASSSTPASIPRAGRATRSSTTSARTHRGRTGDSVRNRSLHRVARAGLLLQIGQLKFRELRERAKKELGPSFDIRTFHDEMLTGGELPMDLLDARTNAWIAAQKSAAKGQ